MKQEEARAIIIGAVITGLATLAAAFIARGPDGQATPTVTATVESGPTASAPVMIFSTPLETSVLASATIEQSVPTLTPAPTATFQVEPTAEKAVTVSPSASVDAIADQPTRITARGTGKPGPTMTDPALRRRSAIMAAEIDAKRQFAELINGAEIESVSIVIDGALTVDEIRQVIKGIVPAGKKIDESFDETNGIAQVTLEWILTK